MFENAFGNIYGDPSQVEIPAHGVRQFPARSLHGELDFVEAGGVRRVP